MGILDRIADAYVDTRIELEDLHERLDVDMTTAKYCIKDILKYKLNQDLNLGLTDDTKYFVIGKKEYLEAVDFAHEELNKLGKHGEEYTVMLTIKHCRYSRSADTNLYKSDKPEKNISLEAFKLGTDEKELVTDVKLKLDTHAKVRKSKIAFVTMFVPGVPVISHPTAMTIHDAKKEPIYCELHDLVRISAGKQDKKAQYIDSTLLTDGAYAHFESDLEQKKYDSTENYFLLGVKMPFINIPEISSSDIDEIKESVKEYLPYKYWREFGLDTSEIPEEKIKEADEQTQIDFAKAKGTYKYEAAEQNKVKAVSRINNDELKKMYDEYIAKGYNTNIIIYQNITEKRLITNDIQLKIGFDFKDLDFDELQAPSKKTLGIEGKNLRLVFNFFNIDMDQLVEKIDLDNVDLIMLNDCEITNGCIPAELHYKIKQFH